MSSPSQADAGAPPTANADEKAEPNATPAKPAPDAPIAEGPKPAAPKFTMEAFGYLRLQYKVVRNDPTVVFVGRDDGFELQNARFGVRGKLQDLVAYKLALEGAVDERTQVNDPNGKLRVGIKDAYSDVSLGSGITARAGYFESLVQTDLDDDTSREMVDKPLEINGVRPTQGYQTNGLTPGRSLGTAIRLDPAPPESGVRFGFELAMQNGADEFASDNDNDTPAVSASGLARLAHGGFAVASVRYNRRTEGDLPLRRTEDDFQGAFGAKIVAGAVSVGGGLFFQRTEFPTTGGPARTGYGGHGQAFFTVPGTTPFAFGYRFSILDPSSLILTDRVMEHSIGAVLAVPAYRMRFQLEITHAAEQGARQLTNDRAQIAAELAL
ncbi:MAG TPA: hypothetical protein VGM90_12970 [Kofleriaceae bacterium]